ncbi:MAG: S8 family serine peptidase [Patescibacteria group bacterium]
MRNKLLGITFSLLLAFSPFFPVVLAGSAAEIENPYHVHEILITWRLSYRDRLQEMMARLRRDMNEKFGRSRGAHIVETQSYDNAFTRISLPEDMSVGETLKVLRTIPGAETVTPNWPIHALMVPNDPYYQPYQWDMKLIQMPDAWDVSVGEGAVVAVADSGIAYEDYGMYKKAPDLGGISFVQGYDFIGRDSHPNDENGHGTHITGIIAGTLNNNIGVAGIAPRALIMPLKILDKSGAGTIADLAEAIRWAADHGAQVVNMSVGSPESSPVLTEALAYAYKKGVVLVAAVGNDGTERALYPAAERDYVIAVGAVGMNGLRAPYSNTGDGLDLLAPGGDFSMDYNGDAYPDGILQQTFTVRGPFIDVRTFSYRFMQGTSVAAPHVSGVAALLVSLGMHDPVKVRTVLRSSATDIGLPGWDKETGAGLLNAAKAVQSARAQNPLVQVINSNVERTSTPPANQESPQTAEPEPASPSSITELNISLVAYNQFGKTAMKFTWWEPITLKARVVDQDNKPVADALLTMTYQQGNKEPMSVRGKTDADGSSAFVIGPFHKRSVIKIQGKGEKDGVVSAPQALQFSIR